jgi:hypothetical protein
MKFPITYDVEVPPERPNSSHIPENWVRPSDDDLQWAAGHLDADGTLSISGKNTLYPSLLLALFTPYRECLVEFQKALGGLGSLPDQPARPGGTRTRPAFRLTFTGAALVRLENLLVPRMRGHKRGQFQTMRDALAKLRRKKGLVAPYRIAAPNDRPHA